METIFACLASVKMPVTLANAFMCVEMIFDHLECGVILTPTDLILELRDFQASYPPQLKN